MTLTQDAPSFPMGPTGMPVFLQDIRWSAEPVISFFDTGSLPIIAYRHYRSQTSGMVSVVANAAAEDDWDVLFVNRNGTGKLEVDFCGELTSSGAHRDLCCYIPAGADNTLEFDSGGGSFGIYFQPGLLAALTEEDSRDELAPVIGQRSPRIAHLLGLIEAELMQPSLGSHLMVDGLIRAIAGLLASRNEERVAAECERIYLSPAKLRRVLDFIEAHLDRHVGLDDLAQAAGLSANHFLRVFKLATGDTPYHFLRARRLERARRLLAEGTMPLAELALECGFANQAHFTAAFSRELGISPGRYRRASGGS
jgi:AraC family transcriptional regulator